MELFGMFALASSYADKRKMIFDIITNQNNGRDNEKMVTITGKHLILLGK